ncbi:MAG: recombinase family protein, partial [Cetobacterium sp.]
MKKIGYIRVSSEDQNLARQMKQLEEIGMDMIFKEKISGATMDRAELQNMLKEVKAGDTIYVTDLTRITRSTHDLFLLINQIKEKKVYLKSLKDTWLDIS